MPIPNDGSILDEPEKYHAIFTAIDGDEMKVAWQVIVDGNLDNCDADYQGLYAFSTCYNSEEATNLGGMLANERDWAVVFDLKAIEAGVKAGDVVVTINGDPITVWFPEEVPPLLDRLASLQIGGQLSVTYKRGDETGTATIAISGKGTYLVRLIHMRRCTGCPKADWESFWAAMTFGVP